MAIDITLCDDNASERASIKSFVLDWAFKSGADVRVAEYPTAEAFMFSFEDSVPDILLLDIEMPGKSGVELAKELRIRGCRSEIVFITSHFEFCGEGYEVDALHYLIKPVSSEKLSEVLNKAVSRISQEPTSVVFRSDGETIRLYERDILYIEAFLHYISICTDVKKYRVKEALGDIEARLSDDFYRTHRSYIVNLKKVNRISRSSVTLEGGSVIPLSRGKYDDINKMYIKRT